MHLHRIESCTDQLVALRRELHARRKPPGRRILAAVLRAYAPRIDSAFRKAVRSAVGRTDGGAIVDALSRGDVGVAVAAVAWGEAEKVVKTDLMGAFAAAFERSGVLHMRATAEIGTGLRGVFSLVDDRPRQYIAEHGAKLVSDFGLQNRDALRSSLESMLTRGMTPQDMQRAILPQIGLTRPWAAAVDKRMARMLADGATMAEAQAEAARYAEELTKLRALNIARTEALIAHGAADSEHRRQAVEQGLADADKAVKTWFTAGDNVVREEHAAMEGVSVPWDEPFDVDGVEVDGPPEGVNCRCWADFEPLGRR